MLTGRGGGASCHVHEQQLESTAPDVGRKDLHNLEGEWGFMSMFATKDYPQRNAVYAVCINGVDRAMRFSGTVTINGQVWVRMRSLRAHVTRSVFVQPHQVVRLGIRLPMY